MIYFPEISLVFEHSPKVGISHILQQQPLTSQFMQFVLHPPPPPPHPHTPMHFANHLYIFTDDRIVIFEQLEHPVLIRAKCTPSIRRLVGAYTT